MRKIGSKFAKKKNCRKLFYNTTYLCLYRSWSFYYYGTKRQKQEVQCFEQEYIQVLADSLILNISREDLIYPLSLLQQGKKQKFSYEYKFLQKRGTLLAMPSLYTPPQYKMVKFFICLIYLQQEWWLYDTSYHGAKWFSVLFLAFWIGHSAPIPNKHLNRKNWAQENVWIISWLECLFL